MRRATSLGIGGTLLLVLIAGAVWFGRPSPAIAQLTSSPAPADRVRALRVERRELLTRMVAAEQELFKKGSATSQQVCEAVIELNQAELELCETREARIKVLEHLVEYLRHHEQVSETKVENGRSSQREHFRVTALRLRAEIDLERMRAERTSGAPAGTSR